MRNITQTGFGRAVGPLQPGRSTWLRVVLARFVAAVAIAVAFVSLPLFEPNGLHLAVTVAVVEAAINAAALDAIRRGALPGLFLPLGDLLLALMIVWAQPEVLAVAAVVFTSVNVLYVVWYGPRVTALFAVVAVAGLSLIGAAADPPFWIPTLVCLAICSATTIVVMDAICVGVTAAHGRYDALVNGLDAVVWEKDAAGSKTFVSENVMDVLGTDRDTFLGPGFLVSRVHPDDRPGLVESRKRNDEGHSSESHFKVLDNNGAYRHLYERVNVSCTADGRVASSRGLLVDESVRWAAQAQVRRYSDFIMGIPIALTVMHVPDTGDHWSTEVVSMNPAAERMLGEAPAGTRLASLLHLPESWLKTIASVARGTEPFEWAFLELPGVDGVYAVRAVPLPENHLGVSIEDVTKRARVAESFRHQARHDALTGLANRAYLYERLEAALEGTGEPTVALLVIDLDDFKQVNDSLGHAYGDQVLKHFTTRLAGRLRNADVLARLGGDEFAVVLPECFGGSHAEELAGRVVDVCATPFDIDGVHVKVGASVGVAVSPNHGTESAILLRRADAAMYHAKSGGGGYLLFSADMEEQGLPQRRTYPATGQSASS